MASYFNPIESVERIESAYRRYIKTTFHTSIDSYNDQISKAVKLGDMRVGTVGAYVF